MKLDTMVKDRMDDHVWDQVISKRVFEYRRLKWQRSMATLCAVLVLGVLGVSSLPGSSPVVDGYLQMVSAEVEFAEQPTWVLDDTWVKND